MDPTWPRLLFAVDITDAQGETYRYGWQQVIGLDEVERMARWLPELRRRFDDEWPQLLRREGRSLYGARIGPRLAGVSSLVHTGAMRPDGDWLDQRFTPPPTPMQVLAKDLSRVLADQARAERRRKESE